LPPAPLPCSVRTAYLPLPPPRLPYTTLFRSCPGWKNQTLPADETSGAGLRGFLRSRRGRHRGRRARTSSAVQKARGIDKCARRLRARFGSTTTARSEEHTSELQSRFDLVCRLLLEKKNRERRRRDGARKRCASGH